MSLKWDPPESYGTNWVGPFYGWVSKVKIWFAVGFVCWQAQGGTYGVIIMQSIKVLLTFVLV